MKEIKKGLLVKNYFKGNNVHSGMEEEFLIEIEIEAIKYYESIKHLGADYNVILNNMVQDCEDGLDNMYEENKREIENEERFIEKYDMDYADAHQEIGIERGERKDTKVENERDMKMNQEYKEQLEHENRTEYMQDGDEEFPF